jgi:hypothetical protein
MGMAAHALAVLHAHIGGFTYKLALRQHVLLLLLLLLLLLPLYVMNRCTKSTSAQPRERQATC